MVRLRMLVFAALAVAMIGAWHQGTPNTDTLPVSNITDIFASPTITVTSPPSHVELGATTSIAVQATSPAVPGERIVLSTPGSYNLGYNVASSAVLDSTLRARLTLHSPGFLGSYDYWATIPANGNHQEGRSASFTVAIAPVAPPVGSTCGHEKLAKKANGRPWACTYSDDFNGTRLNRRYWKPQVTATSGFTTGTSSTFACAADNPSTIAVSHGTLKLSLVKLAATRNCGTNRASPYMFGQIMHFQTFAQTYGRFEVRARIPDLKVPGAQQTFWLWPASDTYGPWPASGEIDFAEFYSNVRGLDRPYIHYLPGQQTKKNENNDHHDCAIKRGQFNIYGVVWEPGSLTVTLNHRVCYIDLYNSITASAQGRYSPFDKPFYLSLNQAMGTYGNDYDPKKMPAKVTTVVDYVRIWK